MIAIECLEKRELLTAPVAEGDLANAIEDGSGVTVDVLGNDSDADGDAFSISNYQTVSAFGTVTAGGGGLIYTPTPGALDWLAADATTTDVFWYSIRDTNNDESTGYVTITIGGVNDAPHAEDDVATAHLGTAATIPVLGNNSDPDTSPLMVTLVTASQGTATILADGTIQFTASTRDTATLTYTVSDGSLTDTATVTVTIENRAPDAVEDDSANPALNLTTSEDTPFTTSSLLGNDSDPDGDSLTVVLFSGSYYGYGTATLNSNGTVAYAPHLNAFDYLAPGQSVTDWMWYTIDDGQGAQDSAWVSIVIQGVNDAPRAVNDTASTTTGTPISLSVLSNDSDPEGNPLTITTVTASQGTATINTNGTSEPGDDWIDFTPTTHTATATVTYTVSDGALSSTATVAVTIDNRLPVAVNDNFTTAENTAVTTTNVLSNDTDPDGDTLTVLEVWNGSHGTATLNSGGTITYTPYPNALDYLRPGDTVDDYITYRIGDGFGGETTGSVIITVNGVNDAPVVENETFSIVHDRLTSFSVYSLFLNDYDPESDPLTFTLNTTSATNGTVSRHDSGTPADPSDDTIRFMPDADYTGPASFGYSVSDGPLATTGTVSLTVTNAVPVAEDDTTCGIHDRLISISVSSLIYNDSDADGDTLTFTLDTESAVNGTAEYNDHETSNNLDDDTVDFTPDVNFVGTATFSYTMSDGLSSNDATVAIEVINTPPVATSDSYVVIFNTPLIVNAAKGLIANDSDPDEDTVTLPTNPIDDPPDYGTLNYINSNGSFKYTPVTDYEGQDTFEYHAIDHLGSTSASASVTMSIVKPIIDIDVDSTNDGSIDCSDEEEADEELAPGYIIWRNNDDTNGNGTPDRLDPGPYVDPDHDIKPVMVTLAALGADLTGLKVTFSTTNPKIHLWSSPTKQPLASEYVIGTSDPPAWIYVEGIDYGTSYIEAILKNSAGSIINRDKVCILTTNVNMEAYRPQTAPFTSAKVPFTSELHPGVGIRRNGDDDNSNSTADRLEPLLISAEDDLVRVDAEFFPFSTPGITYILKRASTAVNFYLSPNKTSPLLTSTSPTNEVSIGFSTTFWVEWVSMDPAVTVCAVDLVIKDTVHLNETYRDTINFFPFNSVVIVLGGEFQTPVDPATTNLGIFQLAIDQYRDGYDVHMYDEDDVDWFAGAGTGTGAAYDEVVSAVQRRGVTEVAIMGYSHGGGGTYNLSWRLSQNRLPAGTSGRLTDITVPFDITFTAYVDAVTQSTAGAENRRPPDSAWHLGLYQTTALLRGGPSGANEDICVTTFAAWGASLNHTTIDDAVEVLVWVRMRMKQNVRR